MRTEARDARVAKAFLKTYCRLLSTKPTDMSRFYQESSQMTQESVNGVVHAKGLAAIKAFFNDAGLRSVDVTMTNFQPSLGDSILVVVTGRMAFGSPSHAADAWRPFVQTLVLVNHLEAGRSFWVVKNDICRFTGAPNGSVASLSPARAAAKPSSAAEAAAAASAPGWGDAAGVAASAAPPPPAAAAKPATAAPAAGVCRCGDVGGSRISFPIFGYL